MFFELHSAVAIVLLFGVGVSVIVLAGWRL